VWFLVWISLCYFFRGGSGRFDRVGWEGTVEKLLFCPVSIRIFSKNSDMQSVLFMKILQGLPTYLGTLLGT
jgi:hypothetical protein